MTTIPQQQSTTTTLQLVLAWGCVGIPLTLLTLFHLGDIKTAAFRATAMGFGPLFVGIPLTLGVLQTLVNAMKLFQ